MDVITGDVIVMVSQPGFDPNMFARGITQIEWRDLLDNPERPLNNKAIGGIYPPGSTYKIVTALAALDSKAIDPWTVLPCNGHIELGDIKFHCWLKGGHGGLNVQGAITGSCDCFFYEAARRTGVDRIAEMAGRLGFGKLSELGLPGESAGTQPSRQWKQEKYSKPWQQGDTFNLGIGQGYMTSTPLQLAIMAARVANGGYEVQPNLLLAKALPREELATPQVRTKPTGASLRLDPKHLAIIQQGMSDVVNSGAGTANALRFDPKTNKPLEPALQFAGKTGTAQVKRITEREREMGITQDQLPWHLRHHGLFVCFGPVESPRYACAVIVEHGQAGFNAGKVGKEVLVETMRRDPSRHMERYKKVAS
jgi:penicillin-binding protein 2